jgi:hypothetical protein
MAVKALFSLAFIPLLFFFLLLNQSHAFTPNGPSVAFNSPSDTMPQPKVRFLDIRGCSTPEKRVVEAAVGGVLGMVSENRTANSKVIGKYKLIY